MQVQSINNNNNNNMNFKALKGLKYVNSFNPNRKLDDAKIVKAVIESPAVQEFAKKYDFMARFDYYIFHYCFTGDPLYSLEFLPVPVPVPVPVKQKQESSIFNFFKKIFRKNESQTVEQSSNVMPIPKETCQNLPIAFNIMVSSRDANEFINNINNLSVADIEERLLDEQQSAAKEEADKILHKQLLDKINQQFPN
ncbi:MAG: hypothetical protein MJ230_01150 [bacterium]|nr:hypothetical protein [bacterium]